MKKESAVLVGCLLIGSTVVASATNINNPASAVVSVSSRSAKCSTSESPNVETTPDACSSGSVDGSSPGSAESATGESPDQGTTSSADTGSARTVSINSVYALCTNQAKPDTVFGYGSSSNDLLTFQFEHFSFHPWGDLYADAETYQGRNVGTPYSTGNNWQSLLILDPRLSLSKVTKRPIAFGPVSDVSLEARFERESYPDSPHFWSRNFGLALNLKIPGFSYFASGVLTRYTNIDQKNTWFWRSVLMSKPGNILGQRVYFNLLSFLMGSATHKTEVWERGDFLWEVVRNRPYQAGIRLEYEHYSNDPLGGGLNYNRYMPELMLKYAF